VTSACETLAAACSVLETKARTTTKHATDPRNLHAVTSYRGNATSVAPPLGGFVGLLHASYIWMIHSRALSRWRRSGADIKSFGATNPRPSSKGGSASAYFFCPTRPAPSRLSAQKPKQLSGSLVRSVASALRLVGQRQVGCGSHPVRVLQAQEAPSPCQGLRAYVYANPYLACTWHMDAMSESVTKVSRFPYRARGAWLRGSERRVPRLCILALIAVNAGQIFIWDNVVGCSGPRTRRSIARGWLSSASACAYLPCLSVATPRRVAAVRVFGLSGPSTR
jgi:hypothetical protein